MSIRSEALAARIEEGAASLAAFAEGLSEAEWRTPVGNTPGKDRRPVGVVVHHVAFMYPIEIDVARAIAGGNAVTDVTWEGVADINAKHAADNAGATKAAALELLRRNSRAAADAVRAFTDEELDRAAPFSLSYAAPVTAQFVVEDHALRHSWHHLPALPRAGWQRPVPRIRGPTLQRGVYAPLTSVESVEHILAAASPPMRPAGFSATPDRAAVAASARRRPAQTRRVLCRRGARAVRCDIPGAPARAWPSPPGAARRTPTASLPPRPHWARPRATASRTPANRSSPAAARRRRGDRQA